MGRRKQGPLVFAIRVTGLRVYKRCPRRGYAEHVLGWQSPSSEGQSFGTTAHSAIEAWLAHGTIPDASTEVGRVVSKGLHLLPPPGPGLAIEQPFSVDLGDGVTIKSGGIDLFNAREINEAPNDGIRLYDHKTCKTLAYKPSPSDMRTDIQAISYARYVCWLYDLDRVRCRWVYYPRSKEAAAAVDFSFTRAELEIKWAEVVAAAKEIDFFRRADAGLDVIQPNHDACWDYGGCPHRGRCHNIGVDMSKIAELLKQGKIRPVVDALPEPVVESLPEPFDVASIAKSINPPDAAAVDLNATETVPEKARKARAKKAEKAVEISAKLVDALAADEVLSEMNRAEPAATLVVFVDCLPIKGHGAVTSLEDLISPLARQVAESNGVSDYRLIDYAKGGALLSVAFEDYLQTASFAAPIYVDSFSPSAKAVLDVLTRYAATVIRGV
jgi:hypothetical protein